jgi:hypothetical protein
MNKRPVVKAEAVRSVESEEPDGGSFGEILGSLGKTPAFQLSF